MSSCTALDYTLLENGQYAVMGLLTRNGIEQSAQCMVDAPVESLEQATQKMQTFFEEFDFDLPDEI